MFALFTYLKQKTKNDLTFLSLVILYTSLNQKYFYLSRLSILWTVFKYSLLCETIAEQNIYTNKQIT